MSSFVELLWDKMKLVDLDEEMEMTESESGYFGRYKLLFKKPDKLEIYVSSLKKLDDVKLVINKFKHDCTCVVKFDETDEASQDLMNYLAGAVFALEGKIEPVGRNIFLLC